VTYESVKHLQLHSTFLVNFTDFIRKDKLLALLMPIYGRKMVLDLVWGVLLLCLYWSLLYFCLWFRNCLKNKMYRGQSARSDSQGDDCEDDPWTWQHANLFDRIAQYWCIRETYYYSQTKISTLKLSLRVINYTPCHDDVLGSGGKAQWFNLSTRCFSHFSL
jgi:hypothetical protein